MKEIPALTRLMDLEEVAAVFAYSDEQKLLGAAVPDHYTEPLLEQLVMRIEQVLTLTRKAQIEAKEVQFVFEGLTLFIKGYGIGHCLAIFIASGTDISLLRQPINLAVVNLDSASHRRVEADTSLGNTDLINAAHRAELELIQTNTDTLAEDERFNKLAIVADFFLGPVGKEILEYGVREHKINLPFRTKAEMVRVVDSASKLISNVDYKKMFLDESAELIERLEIGLAPDMTSEEPVEE
ncbi:MAG: hypothetical protein AAF558_12740 [Verrucomicrobiota bacterium]